MVLRSSQFGGRGDTLEGLLDKNRRKKFVWKLHVQFGHPCKENLDRLIKEACQGRSEWEEVREEVFEVVELVTKECDVCTRYRRVPARPIMGMTMARNFNEFVAVDLGELEGNKFLVMVDVASNYCQAVWVKSKQPSEIVEKIIEKWISVFGAMGHSF